MRRGPNNQFEPIILTTEESNRPVEWTRRLRLRKLCGLALCWPVSRICPTSTLGASCIRPPRPGTPRAISDEKVERVIAKTRHEAAA